MKYYEKIKLYKSRLFESKTRFIKNNPNLTEEQKKEIIEFFDSHANLENLIKDWQYAEKNFEYEDFYNVMKPYLDRKGIKDVKKNYQELFDSYYNRNKNNSKSKVSNSELENLKVLFRKAPQVSKEIDWDNVDNMTYSDFTDKFLPYQKEYILKKGSFSDLKEGEDYEKLGSDDMYNYYYVKTHKASWILGSNNVAPRTWFKYLRNGSHPLGLYDWYKTHNWILDYPYEEMLSKKPNPETNERPMGYGGVSWCISMPHSDSLWKKYIDDGDKFIFAIANHKGVREKKVAVRVEKYGGIAELVNCNNDIDIDDPKNYRGVSEIHKQESLNCRQHIIDFLNNNEEFKRIIAE